MTYKVLALAVFALWATKSSYSQDHRWALGFYGDVMLEGPAYPGSFGVQGRYDIGDYQGLQAQVHGRSGFVTVGADYLLSVFNKRARNFNLFVGAGASQEFYTSSADDEVGPAKVRDRLFVVTGQAGASYYFEPVNLSLYTGYKVKYRIETEQLEPNYVMLGIRYHLW